MYCKCHRRNPSRNSPVEVIPITAHPNILVEFPSLGDPKNERIVSAIFSDYWGLMLRKGGQMYILRWTGNSQPIGTKVGDQTIAWNSHGQLTNTENKFMGLYERLLDHAGPNHDQHEIVVIIPKTPTKTRY